MPFSYSVHPAERLAYVTIHGEWDLPSGLEAMNTVASDEAFGPGFGLLVDLRSMAYISKGDETLALAYRQADLFKSHPVALVVSQLVHYGIANQMAALTNLRGGVVQVFYDRVEAREWLRAAIRVAPLARRRRHSTG